VNQNPTFEVKTIGKARLRMLNDIFYPPRTTEPSCFKIEALEDFTLKLKPQYTVLLLKFTGIEGAHLFL